MNSNVNSVKQQGCSYVLSLSYINVLLVISKLHQTDYLSNDEPDSSGWLALINCLTRGRASRRCAVTPLLYFLNMLGETVLAEFEGVFTI